MKPYRSLNSACCLSMNLVASVGSLVLAKYSITARLTAYTLLQKACNKTRENIYVFISLLQSSLVLDCLWFYFHNFGDISEYVFFLLFAFRLDRRFFGQFWYLEHIRIQPHPTPKICRYSRRIQLLFLHGSSTSARHSLEASVFDEESWRFPWYGVIWSRPTLLGHRCKRSLCYSAHT